MVAFMINLTVNSDTFLVIAGYCKTWKMVFRHLKALALIYLESTGKWHEGISSM